MENPPTGIGGFHKGKIKTSKNRWPALVFFRGHFAKNFILNFLDCPLGVHIVIISYYQI
jgi:hypothetical protein